MTRSLLSSFHLKGLQEHKYASDGQPFLDAYFQPFWNGTVSFVPLWISANMLTLIGMIVHMITSILLISYSPMLHPNPNMPSWSFFLAAFGVLFYQTFDAIDGKQARRTHTASVLGELFDHGCDSLTNIFVVLEICVTLQLESELAILVTVFAALCTFYVAHWRTYVTGKLRFNKLDVTEAQWLFIIAHLVSGIFGQSVWTLDISAGHLPIQLQLRYVFVVASLVGASGAVIDHVNAINGGGVGESGTSVANTSFIAPLFPLAALLFSAYHIHGYGVFQEAPVPFLFGLGFGFSKITNKLIVAHMSKSRLDQTDHILLLPLLFTLNHHLELGFDIGNVMLVICGLYLTSLGLNYLLFAHLPRNLLTPEDSNLVSIKRNQVLNFFALIRHNHNNYLLKDPKTSSRLPNFL